MYKTMAGVMALTLLLAAGCGSDSGEADGIAELPREVEQPESETPDLVASTSADQVETVETDSDASSDPQGGSAAGGFSLYDFRYCEILITVTDDDGAIVTEVWGTPGIDPCADDAWNALDPDAIAAEFDATSIVMNGPRYFVVDGTADTTAAGEVGTGVAAGGASESREFGDLTMRLLATVADDGTESAAYAPELVVRTTTWTYDAGTEIYELTDPDGDVYVMQSYSLIHDPDLTAADLAMLGDRLELPDGWSFAGRVLDEHLELGLSPDGALVLQDELANSYQRDG